MTSECIEFNPEKGALLRALRVQVRVIKGLLLREMRTRFSKHRMGYIWSVFQPAIQIGVWAGLVYMVHQGRDLFGVNALLFLGCGTVPHQLFQRLDTYVKDSILGNRALLRYPLVKPIDLMIARGILEASNMIVVSIVLLGGMVVFGFGPPPDNPQGLVIPALSMLFLGFGFGCFNGVAGIIFPSYEKLLSLSQRFIFFSAGIFFQVDALPPLGIKLCSINPVAHGLALFRAAWFHSLTADFASLKYAFTCGFAFIFLTLWMERFLRSKLQDSMA